MNLKTYWKITDDGKLKTSEIVAEMRKKFKVSVYQEENLDKNFPTPTKKTTRYFKKNIEADSELANQSADDLAKTGKEYITLRERLLLEIQYFDETGNHLDIENWTLCVGSRASDGRVPSVDWGSCYGEVDVGWRYAGRRSEALRGRVAVSLKPSSLKPVPLVCQDKEHLEAIEKLRKMKELIN